MFEAFIGIDWSGDNGRHQKGLKVALARPGNEAPVLVPGPESRGRWSRAALADWLGERLATTKCLVGLDFAFGFPAAVAPSGGALLDWDYVEGICSGDENFYGGRFFRMQGAPHSPYINSPWVKGGSYSAKHLRKTEAAAAKVKGATPQCVFNAIGAAQVGPSSLSGMRFLRHTRQTCPSVAIWPFDAHDTSRPAIVEIFPRYFPLSVGLSPKLSDGVHLNAALDKFGSDPVVDDPESEDEGDALLSAAALRHLSKAPGAFLRPSGAGLSEGWIFGVPVH